MRAGGNRPEQSARCGCRIGDEAEVVTSRSSVFSNGKALGAGPYVGTATNLDTGKTVNINLSDSFSVVPHTDGTVTITSNGTVLSSLFGVIVHGHTTSSSTPTEM